MSLQDLDVTLRAIDGNNFEAFMNMELPPHQRDFLHNNAYSIAQSKFYTDFVTRGIYCNDVPAGFLLYDIASNNIPGEYGIYRFMVDYPQQGRGIGRRAMALLLEELGARPDMHLITICYKPDNTRARDFYRSFGFEETGLDDIGEMIAVIRPGTPPAAAQTLP